MQSTIIVNVYCAFRYGDEQPEYDHLGVASNRENAAKMIDLHRSIKHFSDEEAPLYTGSRLDWSEMYIPDVEQRAYILETSRVDFLEVGR